MLSDSSLYNATANTGSLDEFNNPAHKSITGSIESAEEQAYLAQMKHSSWSSVSDALKRKNRDILVSRFNYGLADANRMAGL